LYTTENVTSCTKEKIRKEKKGKGKEKERKENKTLPAAQKRKRG